MKPIVMKFGGNCLKNELLRSKTVEVIISRISDLDIPVVVVSAMGRNGDPYATDTLLNEFGSNINPNSNRDLLLSCGEMLSTAVISLMLNARGIKAEALSAYEIGIITDTTPESAHVKSINLNRINSLIQDGIIPVIPGFQGVSEEGRVTTLGRGGSDTTAAVVAAALDVDSLEIYTDVDGVYTADPRIVKQATLLRELDFTEAFEFAAQGAKVIHPRAAEIVRDYDIPIKIKSLGSNENQTLIHDMKNDKPITGIALKESIVQVIVKSVDIVDLQKNLSVFNAMADNGISVDFISVSDLTISYVIDYRDKEKTVNILTHNGFTFTLEEDRAIVSLIGAGMTGIPGVMSRIVESLRHETILIYQTTDSHTSISCLLKRVDSKKAICILHTEFDL